MSSGAFAKLDLLAYNKKGIFADETIRKNYFAAKKALKKPYAFVDLWAQKNLGNKWLLYYSVYDGAHLVDITKEIKVKTAGPFNRKYLKKENLPGRWYCYDCRRKSPKMCKHVFMVILSFSKTKNPLVILKDKFYTFSKRSIENSKKFLRFIIKHFPDSVRVVSNRTILVKGNAHNYLIKIANHRLRIIDADNQNHEYCVHSEIHTNLLKLPYPLEDLLASLILYLLNDTAPRK